MNSTKYILFEVFFLSFFWFLNSEISKISKPLDFKPIIELIRGQKPVSSLLLLNLLKNNAPSIIVFIFSITIFVFFFLLFLAYYWRALEHKKKSKTQPEIAKNPSKIAESAPESASFYLTSEQKPNSALPANSSEKENEVTANIINTMPKEEAAKNPNIFTVAIIETFEEVTPFWRVVILSFGVMIQLLFLYLTFVAGPSPLTRWGDGNFIVNHGIALVRFLISFWSFWKSFDNFLNKSSQFVQFIWKKLCLLQNCWEISGFFCLFLVFFQEFDDLFL